MNMFTFIRSSKNELNSAKSSFTATGVLDISKPITVYTICLAFKSKSGDFNNFNRPESNKTRVAATKILADFLKTFKKLVN